MKNLLFNYKNMWTIIKEIWLSMWSFFLSNIDKQVIDYKKTSSKINKSLKNNTVNRKNWNLNINMWNISKYMINILNK